MNDSPHTEYDPLLNAMRMKGPQGLEGYYKRASNQIEEDKKKDAPPPLTTRFAALNPMKYDI